MLVSNWPFVAGCRLYLHLDHFEKYSSERGAGPVCKEVIASTCFW